MTLCQQINITRHLCVKKSKGRKVVNRYRLRKQCSPLYLSRRQPLLFLQSIPVDLSDMFLSTLLPLPHPGVLRRRHKQHRYIIYVPSAGTIDSAVRTSPRKSCGAVMLVINLARSRHHHLIITIDCFQANHQTRKVMSNTVSFSEPLQ